MPTINVPIGKSTYQISCELGEEEKISRLARKLNERVNKLSFNVRGVDEKNILMLCGIMAEEELESVDSGDVSGKNNSDPDNQGGVQEALAENMDNISDYIERLASKVKSV